MQGKLIYVRRKALRVFRLALLFIVCISTTTARSDNNEYAVKAMFVLNFIKYIEWPNGNDLDYFRIGVIGKSEMYHALNGMTLNRNETKQIKIEEVTEESREGFRIIVISKSENEKMQQLLAKYKNRNVLIISDEFKGNNSAAINLLTVDNKIRFEINLSQARDSGVKISSKLTQLAIKVKP